MKIRDLQERVDRMRTQSVHSPEAEANALYLAHREEFETTTVCVNGRVQYVWGKSTGNDSFRGI